MTASVVIPCYNVEKYIYECLDFDDYLSPEYFKVI